MPDNFEEFEREMGLVVDPSGAIPHEIDQEHGRHILETWDHLMFHVGKDILAAMDLGRAPAAMYTTSDGITLGFFVEDTEIYVRQQYPRDVLEKRVAKLHKQIEEQGGDDPA